MPDDNITPEQTALQRARGRVQFALRRASEEELSREQLDDIARELHAALNYLDIAQGHPLCTLPNTESLLRMRMD